MSEIKHVLGISGGKDSAALAIYMSRKHSDVNVEYYTCDTGKELTETYDLINKLNSVLGKNIRLYKSIDELNSPEKNPFDHFLAMYGGYLPSATARWCTGKMKLEPFENEIGTTPTISYVGIRGDENREGYISKKENTKMVSIQLFGSSGTMINDKIIISNEYNKEFESVRMQLKEKLVTLDVHKRKQLLMELLSVELNENLVL